MNVREAARRMGVARQSVDLWIEKGQLACRWIHDADGRLMRDIALGDLMDFDREWVRKA